MSALDDCHALAALLYDGRDCTVLTRGWCSPPAALLWDEDEPSDNAKPLASATGPTPDAALDALRAALRATARERAAALLAAAGEPQPADGGVRRGARLDDAALRHVALDVLRAEGVTAASTLRRVAVAIVDAIRQAERRADERDDAVERVAEGVARDLIGPSMARLDASAAPLRAAAGGDE